MPPIALTRHHSTPKLNQQYQQLAQQHHNHKTLTNQLLNAIIHSSNTPKTIPTAPFLPHQIPPGKIPTQKPHFPLKKFRREAPFVGLHARGYKRLSWKFLARRSVGLYISCAKKFQMAVLARALQQAPTSKRWQQYVISLWEKSPSATAHSPSANSARSATAQTAAPRRMSAESATPRY